MQEAPLNGERIIEIEIERLEDFRNNPFKIREDAEMEQLMSSVEKYGILCPLIVRPTLDGIYEIIALIVVIQAIGTIFVGIGAVVLKPVAILMIAAACLLAILAQFPWKDALPVFLISTVLFWLPELFALALVGLTFLQGRIADTIL